MKIYIVMTTNDNESEYEVYPVAYKSMASAEKVRLKVDNGLTEDEDLDDDMESAWHVWIEELELQD